MIGSKYRIIETKTSLEGEETRCNTDYTDIKKAVGDFKRAAFSHRTVWLVILQPDHVVNRTIADSSPYHSSIRFNGNLIQTNKSRLKEYLEEILNDN